MGACTGRVEWPRRGVYFIFETGELRPDGTARVVRVGTHAVSSGSKTTLWNRLKQHVGNGTGDKAGGNHRGSVFRRHVGAALLASGAAGRPCSTWGVGSSAEKAVRESERWLEAQVSERIGAMDVLWVDADDEPGKDSVRAKIERSTIALLFGAEPPSATWLGHHAPAAEIRKSGLWNVNHVEDDFDPEGLDLLERFVLNR
jgi:hypothetical protein